MGDEPTDDEDEPEQQEDGPKDNSRGFHLEADYALSRSSSAVWPK